MANAEQDLMDRLRSSDAANMVDIEAGCLGGNGDTPPGLNAKELYFDLLDAHAHESTLAQSRLFLAQQLDRVAHTTADLPADMNDLAGWMKSNTAAVGQQYRDYLAERHSGGCRRYFAAKSHALHFLNAVAPTKLVDGAWLYGLVGQWRDARYSELIRIYLEELGEGDADKNHVLVYKKLLATHECTHWENLDEPNFVQGAVQLSLAQHACTFLPEVIGFNLGYEQLPLHLLICAYELNELGIDPYYFTLHVTIDNAATGHAARAVQSVIDAMPRLGDKRSFYQRIRTGYQLNSLGAGTNEVIAGFDLDQALLDVLASKAAIGAQLHSDYCRVAGKTVSEWLSQPGQIRGFVEALQKTGWIRRHEHPDNSRFWNLLVGEKGPMFGVFNAYERQVVYDWIAGDSASDSIGASASYRNRERLAAAPPPDLYEGLRAGASSAPSRAERGARYWCGEETDSSDDFMTETRLLSDRLAEAADKHAAMDMLVPWLSPVHHHTAAGLMATKIFSQWLRA